MKIIIDETIKNRLFKLREDELKQLEENILKEGLREPIVLWKDHNIIIDGHHRYEICKKHKIKGKVKYMEFNTKEDVLEWVDKNQYGRRNLTDKQRDLLLGRIYKEKKIKGFKGDIQLGQNVPIERTSEKISNEFNINEKTVRRAEKFNDSMEEIKRVMGNDIFDKVLNDEIKLNKNEITELGNMDAFSMEEHFNKLKESNSLKEAKKKIQIEERKNNINYEETDNFKINYMYKGSSVDVLKKFPDNSIDMVLTDPPYGVNYIDTRNSYNPTYEDETNYSLILLDDTCKELKRITKPNSHLYFFCGYINAFSFKEILSKYFIVQDNWITWVKNKHTLCDFDTRYASKYEIIWFCKNENSNRKLNYSVSLDVLEYPIPTNKIHSAQKPEGLLEYLICNSTIEGELVLDTFMGSGSCCKVAKNKSRKYIGIEINEDIFSLAKNYIE